MRHLIGRIHALAFPRWHRRVEMRCERKEKRGMTEAFEVFHGCGELL